MPIKLETTSGSVILTAEEGTGDVVVEVPRAGLVPNLKTINGESLLGSGNIVVAASSRGLFFKTDPLSVAFTKTGPGTASIKAGTIIDVQGTLVTFASATAITMPTLTSGTDYAIWVQDTATIQATTNFVSPPAAGNWRKIGGFHYSPGGNATAQSGGDTTPQINEFSFYDVKFRPMCSDPRGMTLVAGAFWSDIYLTNTEHIVNGTSSFNKVIADGSSPPKVPLAFGGNGTLAHNSYTWWEATEILRAYGKRAPTYSEFAALAFGTTEASSVGADQGSTILNAVYTSKWGVIQASGVMWVWGDEFGGTGAASSGAVTDGRGSVNGAGEYAVIFGGAWDNGPDSGSRASFWSRSPSVSVANIGSRGVCDHLILD